MNPVALVGACAVRRATPGRGRLEELVFETASAALADAGLQRTDLDAVVLSASDELDGRSISSMLTAAPAGALLKDEVKVPDSGLHGLALGVMKVLSGGADVVLVISWATPSECSREALQRTSLEPFVERPVGTIDSVAIGIHAAAYLSRHGREVADLDRRAQARRARVGGATADGHDSDAYLAYPLRRGHVAPVVDGAAAVVLASRQRLGAGGLVPAGWVRGIGWASDVHAMAERTPGAWPALEVAGAAALRRAGVSVGDVQAFEVDDRSVIHEALALEGVGAVAPGTAFDALAGELGARTNRLSGDGFAGLPVHCTGLWRLATVYDAWRSDPGDGPVLVHDSVGLGAQGHAVVVAEGARS
jgi:acetyl-CoA acetyltransferase